MAIGRIVIILIQIALCAARWSPPEKICVDDCFNRTVGFYQSCQGCGLFTVCIWDNLLTMKCVDDKVWDDALKSCQTTSKTCPEANMRYGSPFPYTKGSSSRSSFLANIIKMMRGIIPRLKYTFGHQDDVRKNNPARGQYSTRMLGESGRYNVRPCVKGCSKKHSGRYPLCGSCKRYVMCSQGFPYIETCKGGKEWDDRMRTCVPRSTTCRAGGSEPKSEISAVLNQALLNVFAIKELYLVPRISRREVRTLKNIYSPRFQVEFDTSRDKKRVDMTLQQAMKRLVKYIVLTGNVRRIEQQRETPYKKQVEDLMSTLKQVSHSLQKIMTSRGLKDGRLKFARFYQERFGLGLPAWRRVGNQNVYILFNNLEKFVKDTRLYCKEFL